MTDSPDLTSLVLTLRPPAAVDVAGHLGRAAHALLLGWIQDADPTLAEALHDSDSIRPFTCSTLVGGRRSGDDARRLAPDQSYWLRFTGLDVQVSAVLKGIAAAPPDSVELDHLDYQVESATLDPAEHEWAGAASYQELSAPHLLAQQTPDYRWRLAFASPTTFRSGKHNLPVPLPRSLFGGLARKWNAFSPVAVSPEVERYAEEMVAISRYKLRTRVIPHKARSLQVGCVGQVDYTAMNQDRYWLALIGLLADYVFYAGAGYQTVVGLGQARRTPISRRE